MAGTARRHSGGSIRKRPSGRWQVRVHDEATGKHVSIGTFATKADANAALAGASVAQEQGTWVRPEQGTVTVADYLRQWIESNPRIVSPRTRERYVGLLAHHIAPTIGTAVLAKVTPTTVRRWHTDLAKSASPDTAAKAYRLLRAAYNTAVADEVVVRNPCKVEGAGVERAEERPIATVGEVQALAAAVEPRYRLLVLMAAWTGLRLGELAGLTRADVDLLHGTVSVTKQLQQLADGTTVVRPPKSAAGRRTVAIPPPLVADIEAHLEEFAEPGRAGRVFVGERGGQLSRAHWNQRWQKARRSIGRDDLRFHDLRHTGNTLAAAAGASTKELMARMGHSSMQAALRYQHATVDRDKAIAVALGELMQAAPIVVLETRRQPDHDTG